MPLLTNTPRVALIGAGPRAAVHLDSMRRGGALTPVAMWDRSPERARALAASTPGTEAFEDIRTMIGAVRPDLVVVVTHPEARWSVLEPALDAGARAFVIEKPIALTSAELAVIEAACADAFVAVNTQYRWMPHWTALLARIASGDVGPVRRIHVSTQASIFDQGPHLLSLATAIAAAADLPEPEGAPLAGSRGSAHYGSIPVPEDVTAVYRLGEARLSLAAGPSAPPVPGEDVHWFQQQVEVAGDEGRLWVSLNQGWKAWDRAGLTTGTTAWPRDDQLSQDAFFADVAAALASDATREAFPTDLARASRDARMLFGAAAAQ